MRNLNCDIFVRHLCLLKSSYFSLLCFVTNNVILRILDVLAQSWEKDFDITIKTKLNLAYRSIQPENLDHSKRVSVP